MKLRGIHPQMTTNKESYMIWPKRLPGFCAFNTKQEEVMMTMMCKWSERCLDFNLEPPKTLTIEKRAVFDNPCEDFILFGCTIRIVNIPHQTDIDERRVAFGGTRTTKELMEHSLTVLVNNEVITEFPIVLAADCKYILDIPAYVNPEHGITVALNRWTLNDCFLSLTIHVCLHFYCRNELETTK